MDDLGKQFQQFYKETERALAKFPIIAANEGVNFFQDSFNNQAWSGTVQEPWPARKTDKNKRDSGRAILVRSGRLKRSIRRMKADWSGIVVSTDEPYAAIHNNGFRGTEEVGQYFRVASRKVATRFKKNGTASRAKNAFTRVRGAGHEVQAHTRHMNMPRRRFIGNSPYLDKRIERRFLNELRKL